MVVAGMAGFGLMWGWLMVLFVDRPAARRPSQRDPAPKSVSGRLARLRNWLARYRQTQGRPFMNFLAVAFFTGSVAWLIYSLAGAAMLIPFFTALTLAFFVHYAWRQRLRRAV